MQKSVNGYVTKSITSSFFNKITFYLTVSRKAYREINVWNLKLK